MKLKYSEQQTPDIGDIVLVKSFTFFGWAIGTSFRTFSCLDWKSGSRPSNHNGIIGFDKYMQMCVFEAIGRGFTATPIIDYFADVDRGKCEIMIARYGFSGDEKQKIEKWLQEKLGTKYDYMAYWSLVWRVALKLPPITPVQDNARFYCSEAVGEMFREFNHPLLIKLCTPLHIESLISLGYLKIIGECVEI